jgi:hypothetical protein
MLCLKLSGDTMAWRTLLVLGGTIAIARAADVDSAALLARVQAGIRENAKTIPRYVCRQKIERQAFVQKSFPSCETLPEPQAGDPGPAFTLEVSDRARLDVMLAAGSEFFSWPGGRSFQTNSPSDLLGGGFPAAAISPAS